MGSPQKDSIQYPVPSTQCEETELFCLRTEYWVLGTEYWNGFSWCSRKGTCQRGGSVVADVAHLAGRGIIAVGLKIVAGVEITRATGVLDAVAAGRLEDTMTTAAPGTTLVFFDVRAGRLLEPLNRTRCLGGRHDIRSFPHREGWLGMCGQLTVAYFSLSSRRKRCRFPCPNRAFRMTRVPGPAPRRPSYGVPT